LHAIVEVAGVEDGDPDVDVALAVDGGWTDVHAQEEDIPQMGFFVESLVVNMSLSLWIIAKECSDVCQLTPLFPDCAQGWAPRRIVLMGRERMLRLRAFQKTGIKGIGGGSFL
jgi:hypothetical protein